MGREIPQISNLRNSGNPSPWLALFHKRFGIKQLPSRTRVSSWVHPLSRTVLSHFTFPQIKNCKKEQFHFWFCDRVLVSLFLESRRVNNRVNKCLFAYLKFNFGCFHFRLVIWTWNRKLGCLNAFKGEISLDSRLLKVKCPTGESDWIITIKCIAIQRRTNWTYVSCNCNSKIKQIV